MESLFLQQKLNNMENHQNNSDHFNEDQFQSRELLQSKMIDSEKLYKNRGFYCALDFDTESITGYKSLKEEHFLAQRR